MEALLAYTQQLNPARYEIYRPYYTSQPVSDLQQQTGDHRAAIEELLRLAKKITSIASISLQENQKFLLVVLNGKDYRQPLEKMLQLYHFQRHREHFGEWRAFLQNISEDETDDAVRKVAASLLSEVDLLHHVFYASSQARDINDYFKVAGENPRITKYEITRLLSSEEYNKHIEPLIEQYLEQLRTSVERLGESVGKLKAQLVKIERIQNLRRQLERHKKWDELAEQEADYADGKTPLHLIQQIEAEEREIMRLKDELASLDTTNPVE